MISRRGAPSQIMHTANWILSTFRSLLQRRAELGEETLISGAADGVIRFEICHGAFMTYFCRLRINLTVSLDGEGWLHAGCAPSHGRPQGRARLPPSRPRLPSRILRQAQAGSVRPMMQFNQCSPAPPAPFVVRLMQQPDAGHKVDCTVPA